MFVELSYELDEQMPIYPDSPVEEFISHLRMSKGDDVNASQIRHFLHNGTHVDAPFHFYNKGLTIDKLPINNFVYETPLLIDCKLDRSELLEVDYLKNYGDALYSADLLLIHTGYSRIRNDAMLYADDFPAVSEGAAKFIRTKLLNIKAVAIDTLSIESCKLGPENNFVVHKAFLDEDVYPERTVLIYEDVNIANILNKQVKRIYAFPLRLKGLEASPVNVVAEVIA
jgi:kynurenine formamidase